MQTQKDWVITSLVITSVISCGPQSKDIFNTIIDEETHWQSQQLGRPGLKHRSSQTFTLSPNM